MKAAHKLQEFTAHAGNVNCLKIGRKSSGVMVTGGDDKKVNMWAVGKSAAILNLSGHQSPVECVTFDAAEEVVVAGAASGTIKLWDLEEAKVVRTLTGHRSNCISVDFHPFGEFFASGSLDTNLKVWDIRRKGCITTYKGHTKGITQVRFSPDGRWVVSGGEDSVVKLWDLTAGKMMTEFKQHEGPIRAIEFHPYEFLMATGSQDRTVKFWDLESFDMVASAGPDSTAVRAVAFAPDGQHLLSATPDHLKVWAWEPEQNMDIVDVGWSKVSDLSVHEDKLLGCSFFNSQALPRNRTPPKRDRVVAMNAPRPAMSKGGEPPPPSLTAPGIPTDRYAEPRVRDHARDGGAEALRERGTVGRDPPTVGRDPPSYSVQREPLRERLHTAGPRGTQGTTSRPVTGQQRPVTGGQRPISGQRERMGSEGHSNSAAARDPQIELYLPRGDSSAGRVGALPQRDPSPSLYQPHTSAPPQPAAQTSSCVGTSPPREMPYREIPSHGRVAAERAEAKSPPTETPHKVSVSTGMGDTLMRGQLQAMLQQPMGDQVPSSSPPRRREDGQGLGMGVNESELNDALRRVEIRGHSRGGDGCSEGRGEGRGEGRHHGGDMPIGLDFNAFVPKPSGTAAGKGGGGDVDDMEMIQKMSASHKTMCGILSVRHTNLQAVRSFWCKGNTRGTLEVLPLSEQAALASSLLSPCPKIGGVAQALQKVGDLSVLVDFLSIVGEQSKFLTLDTSAAMMPQLAELLDSEHSKYVTTAMGVLKRILEAFGGRTWVP
ncbi:Quinone-dependent D-lactate dehydrogenase [Cymbomonas tetramitiformis]|uniref:Katanin p80 WD40 repeat-containing subunit B1 homolog n=1 Tax=Cymbomonas tetramitiformis TaxID=36881 RepID=A0AAE0GB53_9CHLO|nr:Quinone-dependent D-lactate dehydrogenase [Cymbomonas tetramitiformis]